MSEREFFWNKKSSKTSLGKTEIESSEDDELEFDAIFSRQLATLEKTLDDLNEIINDGDNTILPEGSEMNYRSNMDPPSSRASQFIIPTYSYQNEESRDDVEASTRNSNATRDCAFDPSPDFELSKQSMEPTIRHFRCVDLADEYLWNEKTSIIEDEDSRNPFRSLYQIQTDDLDPIRSVRMSLQNQGIREPMQEREYCISFQTDESEDDDQTTDSLVEDVGWCGLFNLRDIFGGVDGYPGIERNTSSYTFDDQEFKRFMKAEKDGSQWREYKPSWNDDSSKDLIVTQSSLLAKSNDEFSQRSGRAVFKPFRFKTTLERMTETADSFSKIEERTTYTSSSSSSSSSSDSSEHDDSTITDESYASDVRQQVGSVFYASNQRREKGYHFITDKRNQEASDGKYSSRSVSEIDPPSGEEESKSMKFKLDPPSKTYDDAKSSPDEKTGFVSEAQNESDEEMETRVVLSALTLEPSRNEKMAYTSTGDVRSVVYGESAMKKGDVCADPLSTIDKDDLSEDSDLSSSTFGSINEELDVNASQSGKSSSQVIKLRARHVRRKCRYIDENTSVDDMLLTINSLDEVNSIENNCNESNSETTSNHNSKLQNNSKRTRTRDELDVEKYLKYLDETDEQSKTAPEPTVSIDKDDDDSENESLIDYGMLEKRINQFLAASPQQVIDV